MHELVLLRGVYERNVALPPRVTIPPGDDMGGVAWEGGDVLIAVDQVVGGVHFDLDTPVQWIARKAVARNVSDIAAMAALPVAAVCSVCVPRGWSDDQADALAAALSEAGLSMGCPMVGGDVSATDGPPVVSVTVLARAGVHGRPVLRSGAGIGDAVYVSGELGGSMQRMDGRMPHHLAFEPRVGVAEALLRRQALGGGCWRVTSMIDLSDGLAMDLARVCAASSREGGVELAAEVDLGRLPIAAAGHAAAEQSGRAAWEHAVGDGEDYELCFTVHGGGDGSLPWAELAGVPVTRVGRIVAAAGRKSAAVIGIDAQGHRRPLSNLGWEHGR